MYIGSLSKSIISRSLLLNRVYEGIETNLFMELVKEGMTVIDIGANIGYYSLIAGKIVGKMGKVYAFEPDPNNYNLLVKNIKKNKLSNIVALQKAVSVDSGEKTLFLSKLAHDHSFTEENVNSIRDERGSIKVETISIDEFAQQELIKKLDIIKIDVEGAEWMVLRGMKEIIRKNSNLKIFMELWPHGIKSLGSNPEELVIFLRDNGFRISWIDIGNQCINAIKPEQIISISQNVGGNGSLNLLLEK